MLFFLSRCHFMPLFWLFLFTSLPPSLSIISSLPHAHSLLFSLTLYFSLLSFWICHRFDLQRKVQRIRRSCRHRHCKGKRSCYAVMSAPSHFELGFSSEWNMSVFFCSPTNRHTCTLSERSRSLCSAAWLVAWYLLPASLLWSLWTALIKRCHPTYSTGLGGEVSKGKGEGGGRLCGCTHVCLGVNHTVVWE